LTKKARRNRSRIEVDAEAARILRRVDDEKAFHFYAGVGQPTGDKAASLLDLLQKTKTVKLESLTFHLQRKDFQNWLEKTVGDSKLARKISRMRVSQDDKIRGEIGAVIEGRLKELQREASASESISVDKSLLVASTV
jgi:hypothetical protein